MLILLPPSEGKAAPAEGPPLDLASLSFPALTRTRERVLAGLIRVSGQRNALSALGVAPGLAAQVERNTGLRGAPTQPAERVYAGVLFEALGLTGLPPAARARAGSSVLIASALFGVLRPADAIPAYRLSMDVELARMGSLAQLWKAVLDPVITEAAGDGPIVDCRSSTYAAAWKPSRALAERAMQVRVLQERAGTRTIVSHMAKRTRGEVARQLLISRHDIRRPEDVARALERAFTIETTPPARAGAGWTIDVIVQVPTDEFRGPAPSTPRDQRTRRR